ncbi:MAG: crotonase/enoyl-CoA hydratase family protein [Actinobacteria bacterium]|nr:crotonase/enoyl-CoA hydratase family protein [Actinomycetota bacterium]
MASVLVEHHESVTVVTIDRPEVRNAVDGPTAAALADAFRSFEADDSASVAILTGSSGHFCSGADLKAMANEPERANTVEWLSDDDPGDGPMGPTRAAPSKPVIAAIEGYAVAGGLELALWCDLRVAGRDAALGFFDRRWGVPLIDGGTIRIARLIGQSRALDLVLTGRAVSADEAFSFGLVNRVCDTGTALETALTLAAEIAAFPQACMRSDRRSLLEQWDLPFDAALANEFRLGMETVTSGETAEGAGRFAAGAGRHGAF